MTIPNFTNTDDFKDLQSIVNQLVTITNTVGSVGSLTTTDKTQIVAAINEIVAEVGSLPAEFEAKFTDFLDSITALGNSIPADRFLYTSALNTAALQAISAYIRGLLNSQNRTEFMNNIQISTYFQNALNLSGSNARDALDVQRRNTNLTQISNLTPIASDTFVFNGAQYVSEAILDYHQPTIVAPSSNTSYPFIDFILGPQIWNKMIVMTNQGTAQVNFTRNGVSQLTTPITATASLSSATFTPINFANSDRVEIFIGNITGGPGRIQICFPHKAIRFSQII